MKKSTLTLIGLSLISLTAVSSPPNIVFIFADDWGYGDLGIHGSSFVQTPRIDQMAAEGIDFQNFTVNSPVCSPSRVAVMTGKFPARFSIHQHFAAISSNAKRDMPDWLDHRAPMLPRLLQEAGYRTGHFGKWHLGKGLDAPTEDMYGYDEYATFNGSGTKTLRPQGLESVDHAERFIKENQDHPFFVNLWLHETHLAHFPQEKFMRKFKSLDEQQRVYASIVAEGDEGVGRILDLLQDLDLDENTLVVFSSDNGPEATRGPEHQFHRGSKVALGGYYSVGESGGLVGRKRSLYAGGVRVPFVVRWPGVVPAGKVDRTSVLTAVDLLPTFLAAAGVKVPEGIALDGQSAMAAFKGTPIRRTKPIFWEWRGGVSKDYTWPTLGVRDGRWKLLLNEELDRTELYDLETDWAEQNNVVATHPDEAARLIELIHRWKRSLPVAPAVHTLSQFRE
jgi:arylsulfatase A-like enzyme